MKYETFANRIIVLKEADFKLRSKLIQEGKLGNGYDEAMQKMHNKNASVLNEIIDQIGYPTIEKVGEVASEAAWLIIQHAIGQPDFMRKCARLLKNAVLENKANPKNLAYLTDRIAVFEGKPQLYGTQFDWDENGLLSPQYYEDLIKLNQRRKSIGLNTLEEQTEMIRQRTKDENETPPLDIEKRRKEMNEWKRSVGWIN